MRNATEKLSKEKNYWTETIMIFLRWIQTGSKQEAGSTLLRTHLWLKHSCSSNYKQGVLYRDVENDGNMPWALDPIFSQDFKIFPMKVWEEIKTGVTGNGNSLLPGLEISATNLNYFLLVESQTFPPEKCARVDQLVPSTSLNADFLNPSEPITAMYRNPWKYGLNPNDSLGKHQTDGHVYQSALSILSSRKTLTSVPVSVCSAIAIGTK